MKNRILICDDDPALLTMIRHKLMSEGFDVLAVSNSKEAMDKLQTDTFQLVVLDIYMPFYSGLEVVSFIRNDLKSQVPIILLSAEGLEETNLHAFSLGAVSERKSLQDLNHWFLDIFTLKTNA